MIFHLTDETQWADALARGAYRHPTLHSLGFIHLCTKSQLPKVVEQFFPEAEELMVLHVVEKRLGNNLKWEAVPGEEQTFPHQYASIPLEAIEDLSIHLRENGGFDFHSLPGA